LECADLSALLPKQISTALPLEQSADKSAHSKVRLFVQSRFLWLNNLPAKDLMKGKSENEWQ